jgi:uncharacterized RDD family membrane protein YckC
MFCPNCGTTVSDTAQSCGICGARFQVSAGPPTGTAAASAGGVLYARFFWRFAAMLIDAVIVTIPLLIVFTLLMAGSSQQAKASPGGLQLILFVINTVSLWLYYALMESSAKQATLGKMALGLYVTDLNGQRISFGRATGRFFGKYVSYLTLLIGFIMAAFTEKHQALHDKLANCLVMRKKRVQVLVEMTPEQRAHAMSREIIKWGIALVVLGLIHVGLPRYLHSSWGVALIILGVLNLLIHKRGMFIVNGIAIIVAGIGNLGTGGMGPWKTFGLMQLMWGVQEILRYKLYGAAEKQAATRGPSVT